MPTKPLPTTATNKASVEGLFNQQRASNKNLAGISQAIRINDLSKKQIEQLFKLTDKLKTKQLKNRQHNYLNYKTIALLFAKSSTRTRVSFEVGMTCVGTILIFFSIESTSLVLVIFRLSYYGTRPLV